MIGLALVVACNTLTGASDLAICTGNECADAGPLVETTSSGAAASSGGEAGASSGAASSTSGVASSSGASSSSTSSSSSSSSGSPAPCPAPEPGLLAYYPLDETADATTVKDCSGHGHDGTVLSAGVWSDGKVGGAFTTSASAGCIDLGAPSELLLESSSFTVAAWSKVEAFGTAQLSYYLVGRSALPQAAGWRLGTDPDRTWSAKLSDTASGVLLVASEEDQPEGAWTHVAATFEKGSKVTLYVNGLPAGSTPYTAIVADTSATLRIGCRGDNNGYLHGSVDEVRIYGIVLDAAAIKTLAAR